MKKVIEVSVSSRRYVTSGPQLWVSQLLHQKGTITTNKIWQEYRLDNTIEDREMIRSKNWLKEKVLHNMVICGKIKKGPA